MIAATATRAVAFNAVPPRLHSLTVVALLTHERAARVRGCETFKTRLGQVDRHLKCEEIGSFAEVLGRIAARRGSAELLRAYAASAPVPGAAAVARRRLCERRSIA